MDAKELNNVAPIVDEWIRARGTSMDGNAYAAALDLAAHVKAASLHSDAEQAPLTDAQREAIEWAAGRAHVEALGKPIDGVEGRRWRVLSNLFRDAPVAPAAAAQAEAVREDAERMRALCEELDRNRRGIRYDGMPIWDAMCDAVGNDLDGKGFRKAMDKAIAARAKEPK